MAKSGARSWGRVGLLNILFSLATVSISGWTAADTLYNYDASGRLTGSVDASGNAARYNYDSVGNILSIDRINAGSIGVFGFTPASGYSSQQVTIAGIGFSAIAAQNIVKFNGTTASIVSATTNQLVVTVPAAATSGVITVTSPAGTATAPGSFTVTASPPSAPTITSVTPTSGGAGDSITISGTNFGAAISQTRVSFGGAYGVVTAATATAITVSVPAGAINGPITIAVPGGTATSSGAFYFIPGGYRRANLGSTTATAFTTSPAGQATAITVADASKVHLLTFSGTVGQRVSAAILNGPNLRADVKAFAPDGSLVAGPIGSAYYPDPTDVLKVPGALLGPFILPLSGTYTIQVVPTGGTTGSTQVAVYQVPPDIGSTIVPGQTVNLNLNTPGQQAAFTFPYPGAANSKAWFQLTSTKATNFEILFQLLNPDQSVNFSQGPTLLLQPKRAWKFNGTHAVSQAGTYTATVAGNESYTSNGTFLYLQFPPSSATNISTNGTAVNTPALVNGQNAVYYFDEIQNRSISLTVPYVMQGGGLYNDMTLTVFNPDGTQLADTAFIGTGTFYLPKTAVTQTGRYTILVSSTAQTNGTATLNLYDVPANSSAVLSSGTPATVAIGTPGQGSDFLINTSQAQQAVSFNIAYTASPPSFLFGTIYNPDGTVFDSTTISLSSSPKFFKAMTLGTQTGTYKLVLTPNHNATGSVTTTFWNVPPNAVATLTNGSSATLDINVPGRGADFVFSGAAGQSASFNVGYSLSGSGCVNGTLYNPNGTVLVQSIQSCSPSGQNFGPYALGATGTYKLVTTSGVGTLTGTVTTKLTLN